MPLYIGNIHTITGTVIDVNAVNIEISRNNGSTWTSIATNVAIAHETVGNEEVYQPLSYDWTITGPEATQCKFRITGVSPNTDILDTTDTTFAIEYKKVPYVSGSANPDASIPGSEIAYTTGRYTPTHGYATCRCRSAELAAGGTAGVLAVHLVNDPSDRVYLMPMSAGNETKRYFDAVIQTGTTVTLSQITLFPAA